MKKVYFLVVFLTASFISAQSGSIVSETTNIKRLDSFEEKSNNSNKEVFFNAVSATNDPVGNSAEVGVTEGQLSVSLSGSANYTIPITIPKGINGFEPSVNLTYNSQNGLSGNAARGWDIGGISSIVRIPATKFHDNVIDPVDFNYLDRFALDGQRLIKKSLTGLYGGDKTVYETEYYSNINITSYGVSPYGSNYGPAYFLVEYPDGSKAYYGNSADSRSIMEWSILYFENAQGVRINYSYTIISNTLYIDSIKYGGITNEGQPNEIKFIYEDRGVPENFYVGGENVIRSKRLQEIKVYTNGAGYRNYTFSYSGVDRLVKATETSGDGTKSYNPTVFDYDFTSEEIKYLNITTSLDIGNIKSLNAAALSGDFDADGKMDCIIYPTLGDEAKTKYWLYSDIESGINLGLEHKVGAFDDVFPATFLSSDNKVLPQGWGVAKKTDSNYTFTLYGMVNYLGFSNVKKYYERTINFPQVNYYNDCMDCRGIFFKRTIFPKKIISGDFNGDGLSEVLAIDIPISNKICGAQTFSGCPSVDNKIISKSVYLIDLITENTDNFSSLVGELIMELGENSKIEVADFNGDGKADIYVFNDGFLVVYSLDLTNKLTVLYKSNMIDNAISTRLPILVGDYNGDGKSDIMIPKAYGSSQWYKYTSTGKTMIKEEKTFVPVFTANDSNNTYNYISTDYNNDGRTDLIKVINYTESGKGFINLQCYSNINGDFSAQPKFASTGAKSDINIYALPVFLPQSLNASNQIGNKVNSTLEIAFFNQNKIHFFNSGYDYKKSYLLTDITDGNGVRESISYIPLDSHFANTYQNTPIYRPGREIATYPNLDVVIDPNLYLVSKVEKQSKDVNKKRLFLYYDAVSNLEGLGFLGFRSTTSTNWFEDSSQIISNISNYDMNWRGLNKESCSMIGFREPMMVYGLTGSESPQNYITKSVLDYNNKIFPNKVFMTQMTAEKQFNALENTSQETLTEFDSFNNPIKSTAFLKEGASTIQTKVSNIIYDTPTISPYVIGRPINKHEEVSVSGDQMTRDEIYSYQNNLLTQIKTKGTNTEYITEDNIYDNFGNITKKIISADGIEPRATSYVYDKSGRFLTESTDVQKLTTVYSYNLNGSLVSETNPFGLTTKYDYDSWFKKTKTTDYLGNTVNYSYSRKDKITVVSSRSDDGIETEETFDDLGRKIKSGAKDINGSFSFVSYLYDIYNRNYKISEPYFGSSPTQWNEVKFDSYGRNIQNISFTGETTNVTYNELATSIDDGTKTKLYVKNAAGNVISVTDSPGGTINYRYFANGNLKETEYNDVKIKISQDGWGRKTKLEDNSAGTYNYDYNAFGEIIKETTPNGTTIYVRDENDGTITEKSISGINTKSKTLYTYEPKSKMLAKIQFDDSSDGTNSIINKFYYDEFNRIYKTIEQTPFAIFADVVSYDDFGRADAETFTAMADGKSSSRTIKNVYKNGFPWQILDHSDYKVLWQTQTQNARGQLLTAQTGPLTITNRYDTNGFISESKYDKTNGSVNVLTLNTEFESKKGNLTSRKNSSFSTNENFKYDALDRLTEFTNVKGIQEKQQYDDSGRIIQNNLGNYGYTLKDKPYQNNSISVSEEALIHYSSRPIQNIKYNSFKSPVEIDEAGIEKISFDYNDFNNRSAMFYGGQEEKKQERPLRKYYSGDGTMEIKQNMKTGALEFITYIGGDSYSAPVVLRKNDKGYDYLFLQRDYQGSILSITDYEGKVLEKRSFDPWGSIMNVQNEEGNTIENLTVLDRGYTGHEHLQSVGLINMNARLYDPVLRRFLQVDNYIQDLTNTQNYNSYGYVFNNPLLYIDPSGNVANGGGGDCKGCGIGVGPGDQTGTSVDIDQFIKDYGIDKWWRKNINGDKISKWWKSKISFNNIFGRHKHHGPPPNMSSYVSLNNTNLIGKPLDVNNNRNTMSSLTTNSTFVGIGYALGKFENSIKSAGDLRNFKIQDYHPSTKYEFISKNGITDGKIYMEGTRSSTGNLRYVRGAVRYAGYGASAFALRMSYDEYLEGKISGSVFWMDAGMTGVSYIGPYGAGISAFYFMGVRNTPDYFSHKMVDFRELQRVQIDNTRVKY